MNECRRTPPPSGDSGKTVAAGERVPGTPCTVTSPSRERKARADSVARLLNALDEYARMAALLRVTVLELCLTGVYQGMDDADGSGANCTDREECPDG